MRPNSPTTWALAAVCVMKPFNTKAKDIALRVHADAMAEAIRQYLEALLKPDHTALTVTHLCGALKDYLDAREQEQQESEP